MFKKIVVTGPESTGKTTLAKQLAKALHTLWVPEYARQYIDNLDSPYQENDLLEIAKGQLKSEQEYSEKGHEYLICDTDLITLKIWSEFKYGRCHDFILEAIKHRKYDLYFLAGTDIPWEEDSQRENPEDRQELYNLYKKELTSYGKSFFELKGTEQERLIGSLEITSTEQVASQPLASVTITE